MARDKTSGEQASGGGSSSAAARIFRKSALERLSTPDQLDQLVTVNGASVWLVTATLWAFLAGIVYWGFAGSIPSYVAGDGLIMRQDGAIIDLSAPADGRLTEITVEVGETVQEGQVIGQIDQSALQLALTHAQEATEDRAATIAELTQLQTQNSANSATLRASLTRLAEAATARRDHLATRVTNLEDRQANGLPVAIKTLSDSRAAVLAAEQDLREIEAQIATLDHNLAQASAQTALDLERAEQDHRAAQRQVANLRARLTRDQALVATQAGIISEIKLAPGTLVTRGQPIVRLEQGREGLEAIVFLPPDTGKDVHVGQRVSLQPAHVRKEEFGAILGEVRQVSAFPISPERMRRLLRNEALVARFSAQGPSYLARIELAQDPSTESGLAWTSGKGPPRPISPGSIALAEVAVADRRPIALVVPLFRRYTGFGF